jgi:molybdate transport system substrate-binding protein
MMLRDGLRKLILGLAVASLCAPTAVRADGAIRVLAAGSLTGAFTELAKVYGAQTGDKVETAFGPSGLLLDRIEKGEAADLFASANMAHPETLAREGKAAPVVVFARNTLCGIARQDVHLTTANFLERIVDPSVKLGTSTPKADPGGDYAWALFAKADAVKPGSRSALEAKALQLVGGASSPPVPAGRNALAYFLEEHQADIFLAYCSSGQAAAGGLDVVATPAPLTVGADYGLAVVKQDPAREAAASRFAFFVLSPAGQAVLARYGFRTVAAPSS